MYRVSKVGASLKLLVDKVRDDFAVSVRLTLITRRTQFLSEGIVIFNNAVVYDRYTRRHMGMRIYAARCSVGRPSRMRYSGIARHKVAFADSL